MSRYKYNNVKPKKYFSLCIEKEIKPNPSVFPNPDSIVKMTDAEDGLIDMKTNKPVQSNDGKEKYKKKYLPGEKFLLTLQKKNNNDDEKLKRIIRSIKKNL